MKTLIFLLLMNGLTIADWSQTRYIALHPVQYYEINPLIGKHPSVDKVDRHFVASLLVKNGVFFILPEKYRFYWAGANIAVSTGLVIHNNSIGIKFDF